ncbi:hypothetical protein FF2_009787 [Malus domestica]
MVEFNFSSLRSLRLGFNNFQGSIPNELGHITTLKIFVVGENNLSGMFPSSIYNISSIYKFGVAENQVHGELPPNLGIMLPNLVEFYCGGNNFTGNIPWRKSQKLAKLNLAKLWRKSTGKWKTW